MKNLFILFFITLSIGLKAQISDVISSLDNPTSIAIYGNEMYVAEQNKVIKFNLTETTPTPVDVLTDIVNGSYLIIKGNELYVADFAGNEIIKLDLSSGDPTPTPVVTGVYGPNGLAFNGDVLYIAESTENKISKVDLSQENPQKIEVLTGIDFPNGLLIHQNDLYFIEVGADKIVKIDLTDTPPSPVDVITGLGDPSIGLLLLGDELYFSQYRGDKVSKININELNPVITDVITGLDGPTQLLQHNNELFISVRLDGKISKIDNVIEEVVLGGNQHQVSESIISLYPNPAVNSVTLTGLSHIQSGILINSEGTKVLDFIAQENQDLDLANLEPGAYFLILESGWTQQVIKK